MKRINLANTQNKVSQLCLGCMMMGTAMDKETSFEVLDHFVELGGNFLDTANCYAWWMGKGEFIGDESENVIGEWLRVRKCRHDIVLATKVGARLKDPHGIRDASGVPEWHRVKEEYEGLSAKVIRKGVEDSLKRLNTDYIDLYFLMSLTRIRRSMKHWIRSMTLSKKGKFAIWDAAISTFSRSRRQIR